MTNTYRFIHLYRIKRLLLLSLVLSISFFSFLSRPAQAAEVKLSWSKPADCEGIDGYNIYYGLEGSDFTSYPKISIPSVNQTYCTIADLQRGRVYQFTATSVGIRGNESDFSDIISYRVPLSDARKRAVIQAVTMLLLDGDQGKPKNQEAPPHIKPLTAQSVSD